MKRYSLLLAVLVLTASLLTGCGCTRRGGGMADPTNEMTVLPTNIPETTAPVMPSTEPMTIAPTEVPSETGIMGTDDSGITGSITDEAAEAKTRIR